jgi:hypothetical protein
MTDKAGAQDVVRRLEQRRKARTAELVGNVQVMVARMEQELAAWDGAIAIAKAVAEGEDLT